MIDIERIHKYYRLRMLDQLTVEELVEALAVAVTRLEDELYDAQGDPSDPCSPCECCDGCRAHG